MITSNTSSSRKIKLLYVDPHSFMSLFKKGLVAREGFKLFAGLPDDTEMLGITYDPLTHGIIFVVQSDKFRSVKATEKLPIVQVDITPLE